jgi:serine protease Do
VNTAIVSPTGGSVGIGFAIPSDIARAVVAELRDHGHVDRGWLGVTIQEQSGAAPHVGVMIGNVDHSGPAARAGLRPGDTLLAVNGDKVDTSRDLIRAVAATPPGNNVRLSVRRGGRDMDVSVTVGRRPNGQG